MSNKNVIDIEKAKDTRAEAEKANPNITRYVYKHKWQDECFAHTISKGLARTRATRSLIEAYLKANGRRPKSKERCDYNRFARYEKIFPDVNK